MSKSSATRKTQGVAATPIRAVRISDDVWVAAKDAAYLERDTLTTVIQLALAAYAKDPAGYKAACRQITGGLPGGADDR